MDVSTMTKTHVACGLLDCLGKLWLDSKHCDITIKVGDREFPCHRTLLLACSPVLEALVQNSDAVNGRESLSIADVSPDLFDVLLRALYTGDFRLTSDNIIKVWEVTIKFKINFLARQCEEFVKEEISLDNYLYFYEQAHRLDSSTLIGHLNNYMKMNFEHFRLTADFPLLSADELFRMVAAHDLVVTSEDHVIEAVMRWAGHNPEVQASALEVGAHHSYVDRETSTLKLGTSVEVSESDKDPSSSHVTWSRCTTQQSERVKDFPKILKAARLFCVSIAVLEELMKSQVVTSCPEALEAVHEALIYKWKGVCYNNIVIPYRACSDLCNVVVYVQHNQIKMYSLADGNCSVIYSNTENVRRFLEHTGIAAVGEYICLTRYTAESCVPHDVKKYLTHYDVFNNEKSSWITLGTRQGVHHHTILALNGHVVVLRPERVGTVASVGPVESGAWGLVDVKVRETFRQAAVFQGGVLEFFDDDDGVTCVVYHNPRTKRVEDAGRLDGPASPIVCFQDGRELYILQGSGQLWCAVRAGHGRIQLNKLEKLWKCNRDVCGAVCYGQTVFVFERESAGVCTSPADLAVDSARKRPAESSEETCRSKELFYASENAVDATTAHVAVDTTPEGAAWGAKNVRIIPLRCTSQVVPMAVPKSWFSG